MPKVCPQPHTHTHVHEYTHTRTWVHSFLLMQCSLVLGSFLIRVQKGQSRPQEKVFRHHQTAEESEKRWEPLSDLCVCWQLRTNKMSNLAVSQTTLCSGWFSWPCVLIFLKIGSKFLRSHPRPPPIIIPWYLLCVIISSERDPNNLPLWANPKCFHTDHGEIISELRII